MASPPPATPRRNLRCTRVTVAILICLAVNLALRVRSVGADRRALAFLAFFPINLLLLFGAVHRFEVSPDGSSARGRARLTVWLLTVTLTSAFTWRIGALLSPGFAVPACVMAAATILGGFYMLFLHGKKIQ